MEYCSEPEKVNSVKVNAPVGIVETSIASDVAKTEPVGTAVLP
uniref:Uncharacterized protein n=1 Tax=viral metagenome TaxID=1070528 RepID=A0A6M3J114_9ZZZZ